MREYARLFKALADETRLRLLRLVVSAGQPVCVCELADALGLPQYQASKHLAVLRQAGLVVDDRAGTWVHYTPATGGPPLMADLYELVRKHVTDPVAQQDEKRLQVRLNLRVDGKCVVGPSDPQVQAMFLGAGLADVRTQTAEEDE